MSKPFRSITRIILGGLVLGYDELQKRIETWEQEVSPHQGTYTSTERVSSSPEAYNQEQENLPTSKREGITGLGYLMVGISLKLQEELVGRMKKVDGVTQLLASAIRPIAKPFSKSRLIMPMRNSLDKLALRGQQEVDQWIEIGQRETEQSRALVETVIQESMDSSIGYLAKNPQVEELIQTQSVSLLDEIIEEVRERTFSADDLLEGFLRHTFRLTPRSELPPPPIELKRYALPLRSVKDRRTFK